MTAMLVILLIIKIENQSRHITNIMTDKENVKPFKVQGPNAPKINLAYTASFSKNQVTPNSHVSGISKIVKHQEVPLILRNHENIPDNFA